MAISPSFNPITYTTIDIHTSATTNGLISSGASSGATTDVIDLGSTSGGYLKLDGRNTRILINNGTTDQIVIGETTTV